MSRKWLLIMIAVVLVLAATPVLTACGDDNDEEEPTTTVPPTGTTGECTKEETFRFGIEGTVFDSIWYVSAVARSL